MLLCNLFNPIFNDGIFFVYLCSTRNSNTFNVNVNIQAQSKVTFNLTYEELLTRRLGKYEQVINISPEHVNRFF